MSSEVDICNLALSHLGDTATVASINPPDGSAQAEYCQRFYPMARDSLLEMHEWGFATKRVTLAKLSTNAASGWAYAYAQPNDVLNTLAVLDPAASDDYSAGIAQPLGWNAQPLVNVGVYTPQPYALESDSTGADIVLTNQVNAVMRYTARITDTGKFSPLFVEALAASLAAMLSGPVMKGEAGMVAAARWTMIAFGQDGKGGKFGRAAASDANQKRSATRDRHQVAWINYR